MTVTGRSPRKKRLLAILLAGILVLAAAVAGIAWLWGGITEGSGRHDYRYEIVLSSNTTLRNVTLLLPVPEKDGSPFLADALANGSGYGVPSSWNLSLGRWDGRPVLAIRADRMVPEYHGYPVPVGETGGAPPPAFPPATESPPGQPVLVPVMMIVSTVVNHTIDTRDPLAGEPVFGPEGKFSPGTSPVTLYSGSVYDHTVPAFISFSPDNPVDFSIRMRLEGTNSIWRGGWVFNTYSDEVVVELNDDGKGWLEGKGVLIVGEGKY